MPKTRADLLCENPDERRILSFGFTLLLFCPKQGVPVAREKERLQFLQMNLSILRLSDFLLKKPCRTTSAGVGPVAGAAEEEVHKERGQPGNMASALCNSHAQFKT